MNCSILTFDEGFSLKSSNFAGSSGRIKMVNPGGGATGTGISLPGFYIMEVVPALKRLTALRG